MQLTLGARLKSSYAEAASRARAPAASNDCDNLPGPWTGFSPPTHPLGDAYSLAWAGAGGARGADGAFVATMVDGSGWGLGQGTVSADNATASIVFDSGVSLKGTVGDNCTSILWDNDTKWATAPAPSSVSVVHVVAMNHLDVGYDGIPLLGLINNILNRYFDVYFPRAIAVAAALRARGGPERLIYTTHAFLVHLYLHCPANFVLSNVTLACPSPDAVAAFRAAVAAGDIVWHAGAFNTEYENALNAAGIDAQLGLAAALADELGVPRPRTVSLRDVPGTTRSLLPHLKRWNITAISVGVNNGSPAPVTPNPGVWRDAASGAEALFMQTGQGQGYPNNPGPDPANCGGMCASSCVTFPGLTHALCWAFRTDNSGPPIDMDEVFRQFDSECTRTMTH